MNERTTKHLFLLALALLILAAVGCEHQITDYPQQPPLTTKGPNHKEVLVVFRDLSDIESVQFICKGKPEAFKYGCSEYYSPGDPAHPDRPLLIIWMIPPKDFNDEPALAILGHEVVHGRGWKH